MPQRLRKNSEQKKIDKQTDPHLSIIRALLFRRQEQFKSGLFQQALRDLSRFSSSAPTSYSFHLKLGLFSHIQFTPPQIGFGPVLRRRALNLE